MDAYDLVISVFALNPEYREAVCNGEIGIGMDQFQRAVLGAYKDPDSKAVLDAAGIRPHRIHGDSPALYGGIMDLVQTTVLKYWSPGKVLTWNFQIGPEEYFDRRIRSNVEDVGTLEGLAKRLRID